MTCIVGAEHEGFVYIGGDSSAASDAFICSVSSPKVFIRGEFIIGYSTSFRMGQLLQYDLEIPDRNISDTQDFDMTYLVSQFIPSVRKCFSVGGFIESVNGKDTGGSFLLGYRGRLYSVAEDFQVSRPALGIDATGSGYGYALGALYSIINSRKVFNPADAIKKALETSSKFSPWVCGPYTILRKGTYG